MKQFVYFEHTHFGVNEHVFSTPKEMSDIGSKNLYGWMADAVQDQDMKLLGFIETAEVGDHFSHRFGRCVRVKDV